MYPSEKDPVYGTFVKTYMDSFEELNGVENTKIVCIRGRSRKKNKKLLKYILFYSSIIFHLLFKKYDIIYVQTITSPILPIRFISYFKELPLVFNVHGADVITISKVNEKLKMIAEPLLYKAKMIVAPSIYFKNVLLDMFPTINANAVFVSPSGGVDLLKFRPIPSQREDMTLGFVSRIDIGKGWDDFVKLISKLKRKGYRINGIIAGRGAEEEEMRKLIKRENVTREIKYIGPVAHNDLPNLFCSFDAFIFPSRRSESLGLVGIESLACGVPVIGSKIGGIPGYITQENGFLFEPGNVEDLLQKTIEFINMDSAAKEQMSQLARLSAEKYETKKVMKELYEKIKDFC